MNDIARVQPYVCVGQDKLTVSEEEKKLKDSPRIHEKSISVQSSMNRPDEAHVSGHVELYSYDHDPSHSCVEVKCTGFAWFDTMRALSLFALAS